MLSNQFVGLCDMMVALSGGMTAISNVTHMRSDIAKGIEDKNNDSLAFTSDYSDGFRQNLSDLRDISINLNLDATLHSVNYCLDIFDRGEVDDSGSMILPMSNAVRLERALDVVRVNFLAQMNNRLVFVVDTKYSKYLYSDEPPFGREVENAFPKAASEISEAAKCLALQRPTAVVFHLMRAMELSIQKLAESLGVTPVEKVWGNLLSDINKQIEVMPRGQIRDAWSACHTHLYHVKQAWRNDTMHPKTTYTEQEAETVFAAVCSFMTHLGSMLDDT